LIFGPASERRFEALHQAERQWKMTPDEHALDGAERPDLDSPAAMLWGIVTAFLGLALVAFAWWPL
jgi:hypothetical protein